MNKMNKLISMLLVLSLLVCFCPFVAAQGASSDVDSYAGFHAPTVRRMVEVNLECGNADEEFFHLLANAYLANPKLLIETILDLPQEDITYLAKAIAYDLQKTGRQTQMPAQADLENPATYAISRLIALETSDTGNASLDSFFDGDMMTDAVTGEIPEADLLALDELEVSTFGLSTNEPVVASPTPATISLSSTFVTSTRRTYTIKFYKQQGNNIWQCGKTLAMLDPNTTATTSTANLIFNATGIYQVYAKVYNSSNALVATSASVMVTVSGQWHIDVVLPVDRTQLGTITLYNASGESVLSDICLGKSQTGNSMYVRYGNTPTGEYTGYLYTHNGNPDSFGPYKVIYTIPQSGVIVESGRSGIWIHGGSPETNTASPYYPLRETQGCVRVTNDMQLRLQNSITNLITNQYHYETGTVSMREITD